MTLSSPRTADHDSAETYRLTAPATASTAKAARDFVRAILAPAHSPLLIDSARICVSDAVANVFPHIGTPTLHVDMTVRVSHVYIAVRDAGPHGVPVRREVWTERKAGAGLVLVRRLSSASGVTWRRYGRHRTLGKCVWFVLHCGAVIP